MALSWENLQYGDGRATYVEQISGDGELRTEQVLRLSNVDYQARWLEDGTEEISLRFDDLASQTLSSQHILTEMLVEDYALWLHRPTESQLQFRTTEYRLEINDILLNYEINFQRWQVLRDLFERPMSVKAWFRGYPDTVPEIMEVSQFAHADRRFWRQVDMQLDLQILDADISYSGAFERAGDGYTGAA